MKKLLIDVDCGAETCGECKTAACLVAERRAREAAAWLQLNGYSLPDNLAEYEAD